MPKTTCKNTKKRVAPDSKRVAFTFEEFAAKVNRHRSWVYRMVKAGKVRAVTGFGTMMIPASEIERIFGKEAA